MTFVLENLLRFNRVNFQLAAMLDVKPVEIEGQEIRPPLKIEQCLRCPTVGEPLVILQPPA